MASWYHFSKSRAGSHAGPPGSGCSIWGETPCESGTWREGQTHRDGEVGASLPAPEHPKNRTCRPPGPLAAHEAGRAGGSARGHRARCCGLAQAECRQRSSGRGVRGSPCPVHPCHLPGRLRGKGREMGHEPLQSWREKKEMEEEEEEEQERCRLRMKEPEGHRPVRKQQRRGGCLRAAQRSRTGQREAD